MKTTSFMLANYCVACHAHCRYCLLCSKGRANGIDQERAEALTRRLHREAEEWNTAVRVGYYIGYCMDTQRLPEYIRFCQEINSPSGRFLQFNGLAFRSYQETLALLQAIRAQGVTLIDVTLYGKQSFHDTFAGRNGDYAFMQQILTAAGEAGIETNVSMPLIRSNLGEADEVMAAAERLGVHRMMAFLPHSKGRGAALREQRITRKELDGLSDRVMRHFSIASYKTEKEWIMSGEFPAPSSRTLTWVLDQGNIGQLERMTFPQALSHLEQMDDEAMHAMPDAEELGRLYGNAENEQLFRWRDLLLHWKQCHLAACNGSIRDMNDETRHFSVYF